MKYTYDDILTLKDILAGKVKKKDIIGKRGWFTDSRYSLKKAIDEGDMNILIKGEVRDISEEDPGFIENTHPWSFFIPEKEESDPMESYKERQAEWVEANNIKVGDKVRVADKWSADGISLSRHPDMEPLLGKVLEVRSIIDECISLWTPDKDDFWHWPYTMLEKVEDKLPDDIHELDISVFSSLQTIWEMKRSLCPRIKGFTIDDTGEFIAFDNTAGEFFVEDFNTREEAISWLNGTGTKEEMNQPSEPEYVPFDLLLPEDREAIRGKWLKNKNSGSEYQVISIFHNNRGLYSSDWNVQFAKAKARTASQLLDHYEFLDGTPCGKQMASK